jgi:hypothetical protein
MLEQAELLKLVMKHLRSQWTRGERCLKDHNTIFRETCDIDKDLYAKTSPRKS